MNYKNLFQNFMELKLLTNQKLVLLDQIKVRMHFRKAKLYKRIINKDHLVLNLKIFNSFKK